MKQLLAVSGAMILQLILFGCKKGDSVNPDMGTSSFSYSSFHHEDAVADFDVNGDNLYGTISKPSTTRLTDAHLIIQIYGYHGPGTYTFGEDVVVRGVEDDQESFWNNWYHYYAETIYAEGKVVVITDNDEAFKATINGTLYHETGQGDPVPTPVEATINTFSARKDW